MAVTESHGLEVEAKWAPVGRAGTARLLRALSVPVDSPARVLPVKDVYVDTREGTLRRAGLACRVRARSAAVFEVTLKALRRAGASGAFTRPEWTVESAHPTAEPRLLPDGDVRRILRRLVGKAPLAPVLRVTGTRSTWVRRPKRGLTVDVVLDRVRITARGRALAVTEVEAELRGGDRDAFMAWLSAIRKQAGARPVRTSKFERGLSLAGLRRPPARALLLAQGLLREPVGPRDPAGAAAAEALARHASALSTAFASARRGAVEGVHDLRTTSRRVKAVVDAFRPELGGARRRDVVVRLRALRRAAGPVRDLDVLDEAIGALGVDQAVGSRRLRRALARTRANALRRLRTALASRRVADLPDRVVALSARVHDAPSPPFVVAGASRLFASLEDALALAAALGDTALVARPEDLHLLRVAMKRARYAAEVFAPAFGKPVTRFVSAAADLQDALGAVQDARVERAALSRLASTAGGDAAREAAASIAERLEARASEARRALKDRLDATLSASVLRDLAGHVMKRAALARTQGAPGARRA